MSKIDPYLNYKLSIEERVDDLISKLTLEEKSALLMNIVPEIERLKNN